MNNKQSSGGIGILMVIQIVFIVLKLLGVAPVATWSWVLVLLPLWIDLGLIVLILIISAIFIGITKKY
jgi:hypothetical protein